MGKYRSSRLIELFQAEAEVSSVCVEWIFFYLEWSGSAFIIKEGASVDLTDKPIGLYVYKN